MMQSCRIANLGSINFNFSNNSTLQSSIQNTLENSQAQLANLQNTEFTNFLQTIEQSRFYNKIFSMSSFENLVTNNENNFAESQKTSQINPEIFNLFQNPSTNEPKIPQFSPRISIQNKNYSNNIDINSIIKQIEAKLAEAYANSPEGVYE
jgi:hypothetical protein